MMTLNTMTDRPEGRTIAGSIGYSIIAFWLLPFMLLLLMQGSFTNDSTRIGVEIAYHIINFVAMLAVFLPYLKESFYNVRHGFKDFCKNVGYGTMLMLSAAALAIAIVSCLPEEFEYLHIGVLPRVEMELFSFSSDILYFNPTMGLLTNVLMAPITISCLYYATFFAVPCNTRPWLGYVLVAVFTAVPRLCNGLTFWYLPEELLLYVLQLPMHMVACYVYQRTDTIYAPIVVHTIVNLLSCAVLLLLFSIG